MSEKELSVPIESNSSELNIIRQQGPAMFLQISVKGLRDVLVQKEKQCTKGLMQFFLCNTKAFSAKLKEAQDKLESLEAAD